VDLGRRLGGARGQAVRVADRRSGAWVRPGRVFPETR
jgi:hypothetical protein